MFQALSRFARFLARDENQLSLDFVPTTRPKTSQEFEAELRRRGLASGYRVRLTRNRTVVVSYGRGELRIHQGFLNAPEEVWRAIIVFVQGRTRAARGASKRTILDFQVEGLDAERRSRKPHRTHSEDVPIAERLAEWHARYNEKHFE